MRNINQNELLHIAGGADDEDVVMPQIKSFAFKFHKNEDDPLAPYKRFKLDDPLEPVTANPVVDEDDVA